MELYNCIKAPKRRI